MIRTSGPLLSRSSGLGLALSLALGLWGPQARAAPALIPPEAVAVIYNSAEQKSRKLALYYAKARSIPTENLLGLELPTTDQISREDYNTKLRAPLQKLFDEREWWKREKAGSIQLQPVSNKIRFLITVRGVPFKIPRIPDPLNDPAHDDVKRPHNLKGNEAWVDSELTLLGVSGYPLAGPLNNPMFRVDESIMSPASAAFFVVGRIDGPSYPLCHRLIDDAVAVEQEGLWGMAYLDLAKKGPGYEAGDVWIENIAKMNLQIGIPTVVDQNRDTFVTNYPMQEASLYYGWYTVHRNGPLLNPGFSFRRGAVAVHLHSFSAADLRNGQKRWVGPLLFKGAAVTLGNVYEPYLQMTHQFDILHARLVKGYTVGEAAMMAHPAISWQGVVLGDPLYRPFSISDPRNIDAEKDREFKALRTAFGRWKDDHETLVSQLRATADQMKSGRIYEALGLLAQSDAKEEEAAAFFNSAAGLYVNEVDKLRQTLHLVELDRQAGRKNAAILRLREAQPKFASLPEGKSVTALLNILDPPAPPPVKVNPGSR